MAPTRSRVPLTLLKDVRLWLLRELAQAPTTFEALSRRTTVGSEAVAHALAVLYRVGSITCTASRARAPARSAGDEADEVADSGRASSGLPALFDAGGEERAEAGRVQFDPTAPVALQA